MPTTPAPLSEAAFIRRVFIVVGIVAFVVGAYLLSDILLLIFGAVLVAVVLRAIAVPINRGTTLGQRFSLLAAGLGVSGCWRRSATFSARRSAISSSRW